MRQARIYEIDGETHTIKEWAEICGINLLTVQTRIERGEDIKNAL